ncbi:uncharacterized protein BJX67DRAFT_182434 [Aspergillus lucknowensis]|uniref:Uncharacterized protein n=1 Tax=Aspergillus lucknowensis TaxID=176173 RepID=A0ABR4LLE5_9EURO
MPIFPFRLIRRCFALFPLPLKVGWFVYTSSSCPSGFFFVLLSSSLFNPPSLTLGLPGEDLKISIPSISGLPAFQSDPV